MDNDKAVIQTLPKFISAYSTDGDCRSAIASVGKPTTCLNAESDGLVIKVSTSDNASQRVVTASVRPRLLHRRHYSLLVGHPGEREMFGSMRKKLY